MDDALRPDEVIDSRAGVGLQARRLAKDGVRLLPNLLKLLGRLVRDPRVPRRSKILVGAALAYLVSPIDLIPDVIPIAGQADDLLLVALALNHLVSTAGEEVVLEHWDGPRDLLDMIRAILDLSAEMVPARLRRLVRRLGG